LLGYGGPNEACCVIGDKMYIRVVGDSFTENVAKEIAAITDGAMLHFREVEYQKDKVCIGLLIDRYPIREKEEVARKYDTF